MYKEQISKLKTLVLGYAPDDLIKAAYAIASWNHNRNASGRLRLLYQVLMSQPLAEYGTKNIDSFNELSNFSEALLDTLPSFEDAEEYIPGDWGEIKFYHERRFYNFLYGSDICWSYDQAHNFLTIALPLEKKCVEVVGRNPIKEFEALLSLVDSAINQIKSNALAKEAVKIGHLETPSSEFWDETVRYLHSTMEHLFEDQTSAFTLELGNSSIDVAMDQAKLLGFLHDGRELNYLFTKTRTLTTPLPPRWLLSSFVRHWAHLITQNLSSLKCPPTPIQIGIGMEASKYAKARLPENEVIECVSSAPPKGSPDIYIFPIMFNYQNKIVLCSFLKPFTSQDALNHQLKEVQKGIESAKEHFKEEITIVLNLQRRGMKYNTTESIHIEYVAIIPNICPPPKVVTIPKEFPAKIFTLEQLLGVIDLCESVRELIEFLEFEDSNLLCAPTSSLLDKFGSFKASSGILIEGAIEPAEVFIDVNWGDNFRFNHLKEFWSKYPPVPWNGNPSSWLIEPHSDEVVRIASKIATSFGLMSKVGNTWILTNSPTNLKDRETTFFVDMLIQCLQDYFQRCRDILQQHAFFRSKSGLHVFLFSKKQFFKDRNLSHVKHLVQGAGPWELDHGWTCVGSMGIRICIDDEQVQELLSSQSDSAAEVKLVKTVLECVNRTHPEPSNLKKAFDALDKFTSDNPSYTVRRLKKPGSTPHDYTILKYETKHFKGVRKHIAKLAKEAGVEPGRYVGEEAKPIIDTLIRKIEDVIGDEIRKHNHRSLLQLAVTNIESLILENSVGEADFDSIPNRQVKYDYITSETERTEEYKRTHKQHRYLIERTVLEGAEARSAPSSDDLKMILAYIDWFLVFADSGDSIHHGLYDIEIEINSDYLVDNHLSDEVSQRQDAFRKHLESKQLGEVGKQSDRLEHPRDMMHYIDEFDNAFARDFGFGVKDLVSASGVLSDWGYHSGDGESFYYQVSKDRILEVAGPIIDEITTVERISLALDFLTMERQSLLKLIGTEQPADRLPIWEYYKRHTRYTIRPIVKIGDDLFWGPGSAGKAGEIWFQGVIKNKLPINPESSDVIAILGAEKKLIEDALESKALEVAKRHTDLAELNVELHKRDKKAGHPQNEYDVLAYFPNQNTLLSIEAKHLHNTYCLKDARTLKEDLFGKNSLDKSDVEKALRRHNYLIKNWEKVSNTMNWNIPENPDVKSIFVSKFFYWWTYMPPVDVPISFTVIDELDEKIREIAGIEKDE